MCTGLQWVHTMKYISTGLIFFSPVLHPGLKLEYFHAHNWEDEWVETAENLIREQWIDQYKDHYMCESTLDSANKNETKVREVAILHTSIHSLC